MAKTYDDYFPNDEPEIKKLGTELKKSGVCFPWAAKAHIDTLIMFEKNARESKIKEAKFQIEKSEGRGGKYTEFLEKEIEGAERYLTVLHELEQAILGVPTCEKGK